MFLLCDNLTMLNLVGHAVALSSMSLLPYFARREHHFALAEWGIRLAPGSHHKNLEDTWRRPLVLGWERASEYLLLDGGWALRHPLFANRSGRTRCRHTEPNPCLDPTPPPLWKSNVRLHFDGHKRPRPTSIYPPTVTTTSRASPCSSDVI